MIKRPLAFIACLFLLMTIILVRIHPIRGNPPDVPEGTVLSIRGRVKDRQFKNNSNILILSDAAPLNGDSGKTSVLIYLEDNTFPLKDLPPMGSLVCVRGKFSLFSEATNPGQFDTRLYYHIRGIEYRLKSGRILSRSKKYDILREFLFRLRLKIEGVYELLLNDTDSGILDAMILGDKTELDPDIRDLYRNNGIAHALAISGLHISILGYGLYRLLKKTGINSCICAVFCTVFITLYSIMAGGSTSTVRALIMFSSCMLSDITGRTYDLLSALSLSLMVILMTDPLFIYDPGFMLSFGAVLGIAIVSPALKDILPGGNKKLLSGFIGSLSVILFTLPVTLYFFYEIPAFSILLNLVVVPLMGILVVSAIFTALSGLFLPVLGVPWAFICHIILAVYERGCLFCQDIPGSMIISGRPAAWKLWIYYALLLCVCFLGKRDKEKKRGLPVSVSRTVLTLLPLLLLLRSYHGLTYTMLDIGQGDCNVITGEGGKTVIIDCGSSTEKEIAGYRVIPFLKYCGISRVDAVILTHSDNDHINGYTEILNTERMGGIKIDKLFIPGKKSYDEKYEELIRLSREKGIVCQSLNAGDGFKMGDITFRCLSPEKGFYAEDENEYSVVMQVFYGEFYGLFTGDIQGAGEEKMISRLASEKRVTVLKVAHHGSRFSTPEEFLESIRPVYSFISAGKRNRYGHPHSEVLKRLAAVKTQIHSTKEEGAVMIRTDGRRIRLVRRKK